MNGGPTLAQARAMVSGLGMRVTPQNVLQLRNALEAEVRRLKDLIRVHQKDLRVGECGQDPLSGPAAEVFNRKIRALVEATTSYIGRLAGARDALHVMAVSYGHSEEDISNSFTAFSRDVMPRVYAQVAEDRRLRDSVHGHAESSAPSAYRLPGVPR